MVSPLCGVTPRTQARGGRCAMWSSVMIVGLQQHSQKMVMMDGTQHGHKLFWTMEMNSSAFLACGLILTLAIPIPRQLHVNKEVSVRLKPRLTPRQMLILMTMSSWKSAILTQTAVNHPLLIIWTKMILRNLKLMNLLSLACWATVQTQSCKEILQLHCLKMVMMGGIPNGHK